MTRIGLGWMSFVLALAVPATVIAQQTAVGDEPEWVCGKAAAALRARPDDYDPAAAFYRETMPETDVLHYDLDIEITNVNAAANTCTLTGTNVMTIQSKSAALTQFTFRLRSQFTITSALVNGSTPVGVTSISTTTRVATLDRPYVMDEVFTLTIGYTGNTVSSGFGSIEVDFVGSTQVVGTLSEAYYAYTWWPCKDGDVGVPGDNSDKATLDFSITAPNNWAVPSNGTLLGVDTLSGNRLRYNWSTGYPITTYLVSFCATTYNTWTQTYTYPGGTMPVQFYIYPFNDNSVNRAGWGRALDMLAVYRPLFGEYPFVNEKYGLYNFPFGGGMEHQTITGQSGFGESLTSHELSHQWWGDMITCKTWCDIWLNEGFATYGEALWEEFKTGTQNPTAYFNAMLGRKPSSVGDSVYVYPPDTASMSRIFSSTYSYRKGAWVLHQLRGVVGQSMFFNILASYRTAYAFKAATTDDFAASASATTGQDLTWFFDQWVYGIGAPSYQWGWDTALVNGDDYLMLYVRQTQAPPYPEVFTMPIPFTVTIGGANSTVGVWNDKREEWFAVPVPGPVTAIQFDPQQWILRTANPALVTYVAGDLDEDTDVDAADFTAFEACFTGPEGVLATGCEPADFDGDGDIDCVDADGFASAWSAVGTPPEVAACVISIPATSEWGLVGMALLVLVAGTLTLRRFPRSV
ncbi:MAG: IPTL-CTERM sorting domain-containing protein [Planctomycetes bacterium]|nr:IPTL-CTERM sorting domain-containing protein [Planctomycetota bacterium]